MRAIASLPKGKALGPDDVASEVLQAAPTECAMQLQRILDKVWSYCYWPLAWRGGRLRELVKKGGRKNCENFRGLLISDHAGKAAASILYDGVDRPYHKYVAESQCGAVEGKGSDFATHLLRSLLDLAAINGLSIAILFVDLVKAFDRILREIVLGWPQNGKEGADYLEKLGVDPLHAKELADEINKSTVLGDAGVTDFTRQLLASMHTGSWFKVGNRTELLNVGCGGRQGCKFGGVIFNLAYAKALRRFLANAEDEGIPMRLKGTPGMPPTHVPDPPTERDTIVFDVTFVDDEAFVITAAVPSTLTRMLGRAITLLAEAFVWYGMQINWQAGKTEAIIVYRGKGAKKARE